jgi:hypothetical protein
MDLWRIFKRKIVKNGHFIPNNMVQLLPRGKKGGKKRKKLEGGHVFHLKIRDQSINFYLPSKIQIFVDDYVIYHL